MTTEQVVEQLRREFGAVEVPVNGEAPLCPCPDHRSTAWRGEGGKLICGVCHPKPPERPEEAAAPVEASEPRREGGPAQALAESAVDLVEAIRFGIPPRAFIPGGDPWLIAGKRYLMPSPAGVGKSLLALVLAVEVVEAGGAVAILDVENGADEYARRLADVLGARDEDGALADACAERLRYFSWPHLRVDWSIDEWVEALAGVAVVFFDSSRLMLSAAGLGEDSNDDYAAFANALLTPLSRAGLTTVVLDNTGHDGEHARGASAKRDLNEVIYAIEPGAEFDRATAGHLRLVRRRSRFTDLPPEMQVPMGGGVYGPPQAVEPQPDADGFRPTILMERISAAIEAEPGMSKNDVRRAVAGKNDAKDLALRLLIAEGHVEVEQVGQARRHTAARPYRAAEDQTAGGAVHA